MRVSLDRVVHFASVDGFADSFVGIKMLLVASGRNDPKRSSA